MRIICKLTQSNVGGWDANCVGYCPNFPKKRKKTLDTPAKVCYNINILLVSVLYFTLALSAQVRHFRTSFWYFGAPVTGFHACFSWESGPKMPILRGLCKFSPTIDKDIKFLAIFLKKLLTSSAKCDKIGAIEVKQK